ncbi:IucA/IucC family protein [Acinetobacter radioresistens]|uniref:IucA/IucC family protein n=1 Tax=Acinetobacter radioresistens TaxID=40216 RepID=UPI000D0BE6A9|nr:IucA/IucC family protein [Acinetobacter radioresistens]PSD37281.1 siderophore biosynthesis protein [Acinetobacter radioresistens]
MRSFTDKIALQHLVNAYLQETGNGRFIPSAEQSQQLQNQSQGNTVLCIPLQTVSGFLYAPLAYVSKVGRHRFAALPWVEQGGKILKLSPVNLAANLLENLIFQKNDEALDSSSLLECWIQSRGALQQFLSYREEQIDAVIKVQQNFIQSEQALVLGHSMHPSPKSRQGFVQNDWQLYSPETQSTFKMHFLYIHPDQVVHDNAHKTDISNQLKQDLAPFFNAYHQAKMDEYPDYVLLPLHPWQARYLKDKDWYQQLLHQGRLVDFGALGWEMKATTSVRTLYSEQAPWMFKTSLTVAVTNSIRINLYKECHRGLLSYKLWNDECLSGFRQRHPHLKTISDPAWMALKVNGQVLDETICILRENPFQENANVTCIASLCQDHPFEARNRFSEIFANLSRKTGQSQANIALQWFERFLEITILPLMELYHEFGMAFEAHQQNTLIELEEGMPKNVWFRDNQGFYYIKELASEILERFPTLATDGQAVCPIALVDERFRYYFIGNTLFGLINAIGITGVVEEQKLIEMLQSCLVQAYQKYPESNLLKTVLYQETFPYKGNLMTRLYELDELQAHISQQSIYINLKNPLYVVQTVVEAEYA